MTTEKTTKGLIRVEMPEGFRPLAINTTRFRHRKRGSKYVVLGQAKAQSATPIPEGAMVIVYMGHDGAWHVREWSEFHDGRFEQLDDHGEHVGH